MEKRTFLGNNPEKLQPNYEGFPLAIKFTSSFLKAQYNSWSVRVQWQISVARHIGLLTGAARGRAQYTSSSDRGCSIGFPTNILHSSWERLLLHKFSQVSDNRISKVREKTTNQQNNNKPPQHQNTHTHQ